MLYRVLFSELLFQISSWLKQQRSLRAAGGSWDTEMLCKPQESFLRLCLGLRDCSVPSAEHLEMIVFLC